MVGIGNDGRNRIHRMLNRNVSDVSFIVVDADSATVDSLGHDVEVVQLRESSQLRPVGLLSWGGDVDLMPSERADSSAALRVVMANADLVFITAGMHRDIDQETVARVSSIAKENQALVVGVVTAVFSFEESQLSHSVNGADGLIPYVDNLIVIHNDRLPDFVDWDSGLLPALANADEIVAEGIMDLAELLTCPGKIDVSLADFRSVMSQPGPAVMSTGVGRGNNGALDAAHQAIDSRFVGHAVKDAQGIIFSIKGGENLSLGGVYSVGNLIGDIIGKKDSRKVELTALLLAQAGKVGRCHQVEISVPVEVRCLGTIGTVVNIHRMMDEGKISTPILQPGQAVIRPDHSQVVESVTVAEDHVQVPVFVKIDDLNPG